VDGPNRLIEAAQKSRSSAGTGIGISASSAASQCSTGAKRGSRVTPRDEEIVHGVRLQLAHQP